MAEGPPWKRITSLGFQNNKLGITLYQGDFIQDRKGPYYYEIDPKNLSIELLSKIEYKDKFGANESLGDEVLSWGSGPDTILTSSKDKFKTEYSNCTSEGEGSEICKDNFLIHDGKRMKLDVQKECTFGCNVLIAEKWGEQLWIGLGSLGEYEWHAIGVQVYDLKTQKKVFNLTGGLPSIFKIDTQNNVIWIATNKGLQAIDSNFKIVHNVFFYEDFNPKDGEAKIFLSQNERENNSYLELAKKLKVNNRKGFYETISELPMDMQKSFSRADTFYPKELNVLVPYFLEAIGNNYYEGIDGLCHFDDPRALNYFTKEKNHLSKLNLDNGPRIDACYKALSEKNKKK